jgi:hypothetical protein
MPEAGMVGEAEEEGLIEPGDAGLALGGRTLVGDDVDGIFWCDVTRAHRFDPHRSG